MTPGQSTGAVHGGRGGRWARRRSGCVHPAGRKSAAADRTGSISPPQRGRPKPASHRRPPAGRCHLRQNVLGVTDRQNAAPAGRCDPARAGPDTGARQAHRSDCVQPTARRYARRRRRRAAIHLSPRSGCRRNHRRSGCKRQRRPTHRRKCAPQSHPCRRPRASPPPPRAPARSPR